MKITATVDLDEVYVNDYEDRVRDFIERELEKELQTAIRAVVREELRKAARVALEKSTEFKRALRDTKIRVFQEELAKLEGGKKS